MRIGIILGLMLLVLIPLPAAADDGFFVIVDKIGNENLALLHGYPGRYWGISGDLIFLSGGEDCLDWLRYYGIDYRARPFDDDHSSLYLTNDYNPAAMNIGGQIIFRDGSLVIGYSPQGMANYRRLTPKPRPFSRPGSSPALPLVYDEEIDSLISHVSQDSIITALRRLSGDLPIEIDGGIDTIHTRHSSSADNRLASEFMRGILEGYGYQVEYDVFSGMGLRDAAVNGPDRAWSVSEESEALRTTDGGSGWHLIPDNTSFSIWGVSNIGPDSVWITGENGAIRFSSDGGENFTVQTSGTQTFLFRSCFLNSSEGWISGDNGYVLHTSNSGQNWSRQTTSISNRLYDICFVDSLSGWAVGREGTIIHTSNGGTGWSRQTSNTTQRLYGVDFTDAMKGWVVGWSGVVRHTTNGGANWLSVNLGDQIEKYGVDFTDSLQGVIVGWQGCVYRTSDGGANWEQVESQTANDLYAVKFVDNFTGYAVGAGVIIKTTDGGLTWVDQTSAIESGWRNVIATKLGTSDPGNQVIICAHYDDTSEEPQVSAPGADDNGSGTVAVLEAARIFASANFEKTIKFCLWSGEEQGLLGSAAYAMRAFERGDTIAGVFNFDMIAWDGNDDGRIELHCGTMAPSIALGNIFDGVVADYAIGLDPVIITNGSTDRSDHASFWDYQYPAILGIEDFSGDFNPYYHTTQDNMIHIVAGLFTEFTKAAVGSVATLAVVDTGAVSVPEGETLPLGYALLQNYPNPFNAATSISFTVALKTDVELAVFDILGRQVSILYQGVAEPGRHLVTWDASAQASGIYFCRLDVEGTVIQVEKMTLLR